MKGKYFYISKYVAMPIITSVMSLYCILLVPTKWIIVCLFSFVLSLLGIWLLFNLTGKFDANNTEVTFKSREKNIKIKFLEILEMNISQKRKRKYFVIYLEIVTAFKNYEFKSKFYPSSDTEFDLPEEYSNLDNDAPFVMLYNYICDRINFPI